MATLSQVLAAATSGGLDRLDAQLLLLNALGQASARSGTGRAWLLAHGEDGLPTAVQSAFEEQVQQRAGGKPLAYITGRKEFFGLELQVDPRVLIPRPDTETLVVWALELLTKAAGQQGVAEVAALDLGTGSGAVALALKNSLPRLHMDATDASADALAVARENASALGLEIGFSQGSWLEPVTRSYHCIVSNPPYVCAHDPHLAALAHEPAHALVAGVDGLDHIRHIVQRAGSRLYPGAWLLLEHGYDQAHAVQALFTSAGYLNVQSRRDLAGHLRCTSGQLAPDAKSTPNPEFHRTIGMVK